MTRPQRPAVLVAAVCCAIIGGFVPLAGAVLIRQACVLSWRVLERFAGALELVMEEE